MITQEGWVEMKNLFKQGLSKTEIARKMNICRKTVYNNLRKDHTPKYERKIKKKSKLASYKEYIEKRLEQYNLSSQKLYEEVKKQGYTGGYGIVNLFVREIKKDLKTKAVIRFETLPGQQAQVDWAYCGQIYDRLENRYINVYCFLMILGYSRTKYIEFFTSQDLSNFLKGHNNAFRYFGGIPKEILYDNLKSVVIKRRLSAKDSDFNKRFMDFSGFYGFKPILCRPYKPNTKGKVENTVNYVKSNFYCGEEFSSLDQINSESLKWLDKVNKLPHCTTKEVPFERLKRENLISLENRRMYDTSETYYRRVFSDVHFSFGGNRYSVPYKYAGKEVSIRLLDKVLEIFYRTEKIACHNLDLIHKGIFITNPDHVKDLIELRNKHPIKKPSHKKSKKHTDSLSSMFLIKSNESFSDEVTVRDLQVYEEV